VTAFNVVEATLNRIIQAQIATAPAVRRTAVKHV
jgi:hypothetical protein